VDSGWAALRCQFRNVRRVVFPLADGRSITRSASGPFWPIGFADGGDTAIVARIPNQTATPGAAGQALPTEILALDLLRDTQRVLVEAEALGQQVFVPPEGQTSTVFIDAALAPDGGTLALVVARGVGTSPQQFGAAEESLVFLGLDGTVTGVVSLAAAERRRLAGWSPDGELFATFLFGSVTNSYAIQILDSGGTMLGSYSINGTAIGAAPFPTWSPDSRWFVYPGPEGLTIASREGHSSYVLDTSGEYPVWRP
jgi:hypothetical protein